MCALDWLFVPIQQQIERRRPDNREVLDLQVLHMV
jgi:hypothetical protein